MGFDNECIVNIQSLAGEYFCPVCRTLVYPNEALQSQCTHLYCKPCLTYVVGTTKACPYDGYLVTEKDSKPLVESDKALAERIGKTLVHCLFYRSGCSWQGPLSDCTSHCSGCSFGNSLVVCNRCCVQIMHCQVQEHAQNCAGTNLYVQQTAENLKDAAIAAAIITANSSLASSQPVVHTSQALVPQITLAHPTTQDSNPYTQEIASCAGMAAEQWQQFQQYYLQYPGYDPYQQYYLYQQHAQQVQQHAPYAGHFQVYAQHLTGMQGQPQPLLQIHGKGPAQTQAQPHGQPQTQSFVQNQGNLQQKSHIPQTQTAAQGQIPPQQPYPQAQPNPPPDSMQPPAQQNLQAPYQQAPFQGHQRLQLQPQPHSNPQPVLQSQPQSHPYPNPLQPSNPPNLQPAPIAPGYQSHPPVQPHQQILPFPQQHYPMPMHPSSGSLPPVAQFSQQPPHLRPPQAIASLPNQQQANQMQSQSQIHGVPPAQHPQQGYIGQQCPAGQPMQQPFQQYGQQPFPLHGSGSVQGPSHQIPFGQQPMQTQSQPQCPIQSQQSAVARPPPGPPPLHSSVPAHGMPPQQPPSYGAPNPTITSHLFPKSSDAFGGAPHSQPMASGIVKPSGHQIFEGDINNQQQVPSGQQFSHSNRETARTLGEGNAAAQGGSALNKTAGNDFSGPEVDSVRVKALDSKIRGKPGDEEHNITSENNGTRSQVAEGEADALKEGSSETLMEKTVEEIAAALDEIDGSVFAVKDSTSRQTEAYVGQKKDNVTVLAHESFHQSSSSHTHKSFQGVQWGQYYQNTPSQPLFSRITKDEPTGPLHGSDNAGHLQNQMLHHLKGRYPDPNVSGSFDRGLYEQPLANERVPGTALELHVKNVNDDLVNHIRTGPAGRNGEYEKAPKQFTKPTKFGNGSLRAGDYPHDLITELSSKFLPAYNSDAPPGFHGSWPGFGVDHLPPRIPGREFQGIPSRGFGGQSGGPHHQPGLDNVHGWGTHAVHEGPRSFDISSDPVGKPCDHFRNGDMAGQYFLPNHLLRGELFGPRNVPSHIRAEGFGTFPHPRMGELNGHGGFPCGESFVGKKSNYLRLGEPGSRSSFSLREFPRPGGFFEGNLESIDRFRKRMPMGMGWCRICKVNCDSVDGLDVHSKTTEHQRRTMDMVISIKQNAKRQKIILPSKRESGQEMLGKKRRGKGY